MNFFMAVLGVSIVSWSAWTIAALLTGLGRYCRRRYRHWPGVEGIGLG